MYLVDTNIISEFCKHTPNQGVINWGKEIDTDHFALSAITVEEIYYGLNLKPSKRLSNWFDEFFANGYKIFSIDNQIAFEAGKIRGNLASSGTNRTQADMLIAATAKLHNLTLVTRNVTDFNGCGVNVLNPFI